MDDFKASLVPAGAVGLEVVVGPGDENAANKSVVAVVWGGVGEVDGNAANWGCACCWDC